MRVRWLGWAGVELECDGMAVVIDPLADPGAVFAALGEAAAGMRMPAIVEPSHRRSAIAGLLTHLHRDHADAGALAGALAPGAPVLEPEPGGGEGLELLGLAQADAELERSGLGRRVAPWTAVERDPFRLTALPSVDGTGDPQVSWLVEARGRRVLHLGDTMFHGFWWRMALRHGPFDIVFAPVNGARVSFPHRRPPSPLAAVMDPEQAAIAGELLGARTVVAMHFGGYDRTSFYRPVDDADQRFVAAAECRGYEPAVLEPGETVEVGAPGAAVA